MRNLKSTAIKLPDSLIAHLRLAWTKTLGKNITTESQASIIETIAGYDVEFFKAYILRSLARKKLENTPEENIFQEKRAGDLLIRLDRTICYGAPFTNSGFETCKILSSNDISNKNLYLASRIGIVQINGGVQPIKKSLILKKVLLVSCFFYFALAIYELELALFRQGILNNPFLVLETIQMFGSILLLMHFSCIKPIRVSKTILGIARKSGLTITKRSIKQSLKKISSDFLHGFSDLHQFNYNYNYNYNRNCFFCKIRVRLIQHYSRVSSQRKHIFPPN